MESKDCGDCGHFSGVSAPISFLECQDNVSSHLKYYCRSSKILELDDFMLFRSGHFGLEMEKVKQMFVCSKHRNALGNIGNAVKVLASIQRTKETVRLLKETECSKLDWPEMFLKSLRNYSCSPDHISNIFFQFLDCEG